MSNFEKKVVPYLTYLGTRPILPDELEQYELHHRARIAIKPGITGMWQVSGRSDITDFEEIVRLDTEYISEWNIGLDIKILFNYGLLFVVGIMCANFNLINRLSCCFSKEKIGKYVPLILIALGGCRYYMLKLY